MSEILPHLPGTSCMSLYPSHFGMQSTQCHGVRRELIERPNISIRELVEKVLEGEKEDSLAYFI